ncbi:MAG: transaldolase [Alphaproteobacteria bacterium]
MAGLDELKVKIFADGADLEEIRRLYSTNPLIKGYTTNPTLMRKAGIDDYERFGRAALAAVPDRPVSLEVFADELDEMVAQGLTIASWGKNANVKVPVMNTKGTYCGPAIARLAQGGVLVNVTAIMTAAQVKAVARDLNPEVPAIVSVFAGRIADAGIDPETVMRDCKNALEGHPQAELLWASPREVFNIFQADKVGCGIITVSNDILAKLGTVGKDLDEYSLETVKMFHRDATAAGYDIRVAESATAE